MIGMTCHQRYTHNTTTSFQHGLQRLKLPAETCEEALELMHMGEWLRRKELPLWCVRMACGQRHNKGMYDGKVVVAVCAHLVCVLTREDSARDVSIRHVVL